MLPGSCAQAGQEAAGKATPLKTSELAVVGVWVEVCCCEAGDGAESATPFQGTVMEDLGTNPAQDP